MYATNNDQLPCVLTVSELAQYLGIGKNTAYKLVNNGIIPSVRVGRQIRISRDVLVDFWSSSKAS